jgi:hypothetical protein
VSTPGWYPDPAGRPGHYRLWDGQGWGLSTSPDPPGGPSAAPPPPPRRRVAPWVVAGAVLLVVLVVVGAIALRPDGQAVAGPTPSPAVGSTAEGDPSSAPSSVGPSPSPDAPSPLATPSASPSPSASTSVDCPVGSPFSRQDYAQDGRVHGGNLSFPRQAGWEDPGPQASAFTWAYDLGETDIQLEQTRYASYAVGAVSVADGFENPRTAARLAMQCTVASALYSNVSSRTDLVDEETTVDGHSAWTLRSEIRTYDSRTSYQGDTVEITVVDLDSDEALAFFWGSAPIGDDTFTSRLDEVVQQLRVN